ncbi:two-component regulator propeller domain-containing protein [Tamlana sp. 2_MG-2023]|uniref:hybrid sensor histidine kinase/response regulator transcription factor n=1 Tax=unclassified Tamlana TaxID=2614803 RepID=UPI0026E2A103|nr:MULTISPECIES: hybrid sensor histidine kinase/response regulator transcription factor [unclassified Tamlana]MDO6759114.1 two-component regulator propeller domain-containing protein [Tamlana sp. 2_MG-2023]MDO6789813.1 two-component regulator propeller domain-containing protein [Tamlana sp. 1_MG-2023]
MKLVIPKTKISYYIAVCVMLCAVDGLCQKKVDQNSLQKQFAFKALTIEDGLSQNCVISITQDSIGYLWMATQDGLNKYDGRKFTHYKKQFENITRSTFSKLGEIYIDKQNRLWIITHGGQLELYNQDTDTFTPIKLAYKICSIYQDQKLNIYLGTYNQGLLKLDLHTKQASQIPETQIQKQTVYNFLETESSLYMATSGGVFSYSNNSELIKVAINNSSTPHYSTLEESKDGTIWLGSYGDGLFYKTPNSNEFQQFQHSKLPIDINIEDLLVDNKNLLWLATYGDGVFLINKEEQEVKNFKANKSNPFAIQYNDILCLFEDNTGVVWCGSDGTGANYYDEHLIKFNILTNNQVPQNTSVDMVRSLCTDSKNNIWIGTYGRGLTRFNLKQKTYQTFTTKNSSLSTSRIISLNYFDGELWVGHQVKGLNTLSSSGKFIDYPALSNLTIWNIIAETRDKRWLSTEQHGLLLFDTNKGIIKTFNQSNSSLPTNNIRALTKQNDSILWLGADNAGVYRLNVKTNHTEKIEKLDYKIKSLLIQDDILWVGTNGAGLIKYNTVSNDTIIYTQSDGLPNQVIYGVLPDANQNLWLSTNNGISKFSPSKNSNAFENFSTDDGLQGTEFNTGAYCKAEDGTLFFGGLEGINWFKPDQITYNSVKPKTIISSFEVFSENREMIENDQLKHNENTITFAFSSLHFSLPEKSAFKYKLDNHDEDWINSKHNNLAHYTNLPPNTYTFQVISSNYDGVWNDEPARYTFEIKKPWYLDSFAILLYNLLFILLCYIVYYYAKLRWHMRMQLSLENAETNRLKKLDEYKTQLYTNISHEIRTPLTLILGPVDNQLSKENLSSKDKKELTLVKQNANRLLNLVDQMLNLSVIDSSQMKLKVSEGNLSLLLKQIMNAFQYSANKKDLNISAKIENLNNVWFDRDIIEKICANLFSNAIKYTTGKNDIIFEAHRQEDFLVLSIINTSTHVEGKDLSKLFQRFYQDNEMSDGVGVGLALVRDLVALSKGTIVANNLGNSHIQFTVSLPITKNAFNQDEIINCTISEKPKALMLQNENSPKPLKDKPQLLIVEDEEDILAFIESIFNDNYQISQACNGEEGLKKALQIIPDVVISDVMMPISNGIKLCDSIKTNSITSHIPVILLTAKAGDHNEIEGLKTGADAYVTKPFNSDKLKIIVENLIKNRKKIHEQFNNTLNLNPKLAITSTEAVFLKRLQSIIDAHITDPKFNSELFAEYMIMSRTQLHRKLKAISNCTTSEFIRLQRLKLAKELLVKSDATVAEIGYQVGFNTPSYFIKCFKALYKCTPTEFTSK